MFSKEVLEEVRRKADLVDYLEKNGIALRVSGANFVGLCPFHSERSPSFNVRPGIQRYHCFGCGENGDIFDLVKHLESLSFTGAVQYVADMVGVQIVNEEEDEMYRKLKRLHQICAIASEFFHENFKRLPEQHPAKKNLADRNLLEFAETDPSIGYAPNGGLMKLLYEKRFSKDEIVEAGLAKLAKVEGNDDTNRVSSIHNGEVREVFRNRLMWTIYDITGKPVGFSGRKVYENDTVSPKYVNSPQTPLYNKSKALLGLNFARKSIVEERAVYVVEGQTDVMALQAAGIRNVVASCGTAFGKTHAEILERLAATARKKNEQFRFYFCFDGDEAGTKAALSVFNKIPEIQLNSYVVSLSDPSGTTTTLDPCDLRLKFGDDVLRSSLTNAVSMVEFILKQELKNWNTLTPEGRSGFINAAKPILALIKDPLAHDAYLRKMSFWSGVPYSQLVEVVRKTSNRQSAPQQNQQQTNHLTIDDKIFAAFLQYPEQMMKVWQSKDIPFEFFSDPELAKHMIMDRPEESPLMFTDLSIPEGREEENLQRLADMFLRIKYMEAVEQLNARVAAASSDEASLMDETLLLEIITEQQNLKKRYKQN